MRTAQRRRVIRSPRPLNTCECGDDLELEISLHVLRRFNARICPGEYADVDRAVCNSQPMTAEIEARFRDSGARVSKPPYYVWNPTLDAVFILAWLGPRRFRVRDCWKL